MPQWVFQTHSFFSSPGSLHTRPLWAGIFLEPRSGCGAWAAGWCSRCTRCLQGSPQDSWVIQYSQCSLPAPLHTACLQKEHSMEDRAKRGHPAALLQHPQLHGWQTRVFLFASAAGTALLASLSHVSVCVCTHLCVYRHSRGGFEHSPLCPSFSLFNLPPASHSTAPMNPEQWLPL